MYPESLFTTTTQWEALGLPSMAEHVERVNIYDAYLEDSGQAFKLMTAFVEYPEEILTKAISEMHEKFGERFDMDKFPTENSEKYSPINQMKPIQEILLAVQARCAIANDCIYKLCNEKLETKTIRFEPVTRTGADFESMNSDL